MILRFLAFVLLVYLVIYFMRALFVKPFKQGYGSQQGRRSADPNTNRKQRKEGDVTITYDPQKRRGDNQSLGEYVDYEEVKD